MIDGDGRKLFEPGTDLELVAGKEEGVADCKFCKRLLNNQVRRFHQ